MNHQDWNMVVFNKNNEKKKKPHHQVTKSQKLDQTELEKHQKVSLSLSKAIQQARIAKGYKTQKELASAIGVQSNLINSYESGKAIPDNAILQKLRRVLGVKLS